MQCHCSKHSVISSEMRMRRTHVTPLCYLAVTDTSGGVARQQKIMHAHESPFYHYTQFPHPITITYRGKKYSRILFEQGGMPVNSFPLFKGQNLKLWAPSNVAQAVMLLIFIHEIGTQFKSQPEYRLSWLWLFVTFLVLHTHAGTTTSLHILSNHPTICHCVWDTNSNVQENTNK
jgi:hypothetical protein